MCVKNVAIKNKIKIKNGIRVKINDFFYSAGDPLEPL